MKKSWTKRIEADCSAIPINTVASYAPIILNHTIGSRTKVGFNSDNYLTTVNPTYTCTLHLSVVDSAGTALNPKMKVEKDATLGGNNYFLVVQKSMSNTDWKGTPPAASHDATNYYRIKAVWASTASSPEQFVAITSKILLNCSKDHVFPGTN